MSERPAILPHGAIRYDGLAAAFRLHDPRAPAVAPRVIHLLRSRAGPMPAEDIGSTAVPAGLARV